MWHCYAPKTEKADQSDDEPRCDYRTSHSDTAGMVCDPVSAADAVCHLDQCRICGVESAD